MHIRISVYRILVFETKKRKEKRGPHWPVYA